MPQTQRTLKVCSPHAAKPGCNYLDLDRIRIDRTHISGSINPVNPVYMNKVEQIHVVDGIADGDSNQPRSALAAAVAQAKPGHTVLMSPGICQQAALVTVPGITIKGEPGAHLQGRAVEGKAALVVRADDVVIDGIECSGIRVRVQNGACVRIEGRNITIRNVYFHDNEEGVLGGVGGIVLVEVSLFERNGARKVSDLCPRECASKRTEELELANVWSWLGGKTPSGWISAHREQRDHL